MKKHVKNFTDYYDICADDVIMCQYCNQEIAVDIHHIVYKSQGGSDDVGNLIALGRKCHSEHHTRNSPTTEEIKAKQLITYLPF